MSVDADEKARAAYRDELQALVGRGVPKAYSNWSYQRSLEFKEAVGQANQALGKKSPSLALLKAATVRLRAFWS